MKLRVAITALLLLYLLGLVVYSVRPTTWHGQLATPSGVATQEVKVQCGALWGSPSVNAPPSTAYPIAGTPCAERDSARMMSYVSVIFALSALALLVFGIRRRYRADLAAS